jgi:hypothetical protein
MKFLCLAYGEAKDDAADVNEVIRLVAGTPCARAKGAIEIRPITVINDDGLRPR